MKPFHRHHCRRCGKLYCDDHMAEELSKVYGWDHDIEEPPRFKLCVHCERSRDFLGFDCSCYFSCLSLVLSWMRRKNTKPHLKQRRKRILKETLSHQSCCGLSRDRRTRNQRKRKRNQARQRKVEEAILRRKRRKRRKMMIECTP